MKLGHEQGEAGDRGGDWRVILCRGVERDDRDEGSAGECRRRSSWHHQPEKMQQRAVDSGMQQRQQKQPPNVVYALHITLPAVARSHWSVEQA